MTTTTVHHGLRRRTLAWLSIAALLAVGIVAATTTAAHADGHSGFWADAWPTLNDEVPEYEYEFELDEGEECDINVVLYTIGEDADPDEPINTAVEVDEETETSGTIRFPEVGAGVYWLQVADCVFDDGETEPDAFALFATVPVWFGQIDLSKSVEGDPADDATFVIEVECQYTDPDDGELLDTSSHVREFGADGGSSPIVVYPLTLELAADIACTVAETEDGGADEVDIEGGDVLMLLDETVNEDGDALEFNFDELQHTTTVTNTFPEAQEEDEDEDDEDEDEDDEDDDEDEPEAQPAQPVEAQPDYTG